MNLDSKNIKRSRREFVMDPNYRETKTERRKKAIESKIKTSLRPTVRLRYKKGKEGIPREKTPR